MIKRKKCDLLHNRGRNKGCPPHRKGGIVNGKRPITADSALRLQRYLGVESRFWLNLQTETAPTDIIRKRFRLN